MSIRCQFSVSPVCFEASCQQSELNCFNLNPSFARSKVQSNKTIKTHLCKSWERFFFSFVEIQQENNRSQINRPNIEIGHRQSENRHGVSIVLYSLTAKESQPSIWHDSYRLKRASSTSFGDLQKSISACYQIQTESLISTFPANIYYPYRTEYKAIFFSANIFSVCRMQHHEEERRPLRETSRSPHIILIL